MNSDSLFFSILFFCVASIFAGFATFIYGINIEDKNLINIGFSLIGAGAFCLVISLIAYFIYETKVKK